MHYNGVSDGGMRGTCRESRAEKYCERSFLSLHPCNDSESPGCSRCRCSSWGLVRPDEVESSEESEYVQKDLGNHLPRVDGREMVEVLKHQAAIYI